MPLSARRLSAFALLPLLALLGAGACGSNTVALDDLGGADSALPLDAARPDGVLTGDAPAAPDGGPVADSGGCPTYQRQCGGQCIPVVDDPANCGGCGVACSGDQACSGGQCSGSCLSGLDICENRCVDLQSDNRHCGGCGTACSADQGCVAGRCENVVPVDPTGARCQGGGPPVVVGGFADNRERCTGGLSQTSFRWALCSCDFIRLSARLNTDGYDSTLGPYVPGSLGAGVGANGAYQQPNEAHIFGPLWCGGPDAVAVRSPAEVRQELRLGGALDATNQLTVGEDALINGDVGATVPISIAGDLHVPVGANVSENVAFDTLVREPVTVPPPCDCAADQLIPVASIVEYHRTRNDNAAIGLDADAFVEPGQAQRLDLPCGRYYLSTLGSSQAMTIAVHGRTALFIDEVDTGAPLTITLDPTAELDIFVGGRLNISGPLSVGSPSYPALSRLYLGSPDGLVISNVGLLAANLYVPAGEVRASGPLQMYGAVFAGAFTASNDVDIHYDRAVLASGQACGLPPPGVPVPPPGQPGSPGECQSCRDCGNQACVTPADNGPRICGACQTSADCCAPLSCYQGSCIPIRPQG